MIPGIQYALNWTRIAGMAAFRNQDLGSGESGAMVSLDELEERARSVLPAETYDYIAGGAEDESTVRDNRAAFSRYRFRFHVLASSDSPSLASELLGHPLSLPVHLAPSATQRLAHPEGELGAARAAARAGVIYCLSTLSTISLEEVAAAGGTRWFQLYLYEDRELAGELVDRAHAAGYSAVVFTVDVPILGRRERDLRRGWILPRGVHYANVPESFEKRFDASLSWPDLEWLAGRSRLPVVVKGVVRADDARRCLEHGAKAIIVSNHGGRQLDHAIASLDALPDIVQEVGTETPVLLDGGVRRGTDVLKALALGARGVFVGRPLLWALAFAGEAGVKWMLQQFREELVTSMTLLGARNLGELTPDLLARS